MKTEAEKIVFFFPWNEVSGGPYYLSGLANEIAKDSNYKVYYSDYEPGLTDKLLQKDRVTKLIFKTEESNIPFDEPITLITPIYWAHQVPNLHPESKIVFFNWHNMCIPVLKKELIKKQLFKFLSLVNKTDSVFFLDKAHWQAQNTKTITFKEKYVPSSIPTKNQVAKSELVDKKEINIAILGRLCWDKISSVINLLDNLEKLPQPVKKNLYIIGDGEWKHQIIPSNYHNNITIHFKGTVVGDELNEFLANKVDILFAMGTSALEGAALKLPSVIIPHSMTAMNCDQYVYLQNTKYFCLGWYDDQISDLGLKTLTLAEVIDDVYKHGLKSKLGKESYQYYFDNHTIQNTVIPFKAAIKDSTLNYAQLKKDIISKLISYRKFKKYKMFGITWLEIYKNRSYTSTKIVLLKFFTLLKIKQTKDPTVKHISLFGFSFLKIKVISYSI